MKATKTDWSAEDIFIEWLREFASLTSRTANPNKAVVLIVDGSKTHLRRAIIEEAVKLGVHLVALPSHLTDVVQTLDLSVFKPFKAAVKKRQRDSRAKNRGKNITPSLFVKFFNESWMQCVTPSVIMSGFRRAGISPFSPENFLASVDPCRVAYQAQPPSAAEPAAEPAAEAVLPSLEASPKRVEKVDFQCQATSRVINMATRHDPWNMRLGCFVTSLSFREAAANDEKEKERNPEKPAAWRQAGRVRPRALPQHQEPRAKRARQDAPPQTTVQWRTQTQNSPLPRTWNTVPTPMETLSPQSMCHIAQALKDKCKGSVFLNTTIPQKQKNCDTVLQPCSLCQCVGASGQGKNARKTLCRAKKDISKKKQGFCMKKEREHFVGPRTILQRKTQGFCVVFLSILKIGPTGPTTGHWTENRSFYLISSIKGGHGERNKG